MTTHETPCSLVRVPETSSQSDCGTRGGAGGSSTRGIGGAGVGDGGGTGVVGLGVGSGDGDGEGGAGSLVDGSTVGGLGDALSGDGDE